ncbi:hypothetical protein MCOR14_011605 [Pyricularia oryzae]|uniref:Uncharacterized protein n=1 Tax=Pyricularia oryzae TaxID=318829 RepID=A0A4P7NJJ1_PYROR|nr:hypothetical protein MCOR34_005331 [Pyricularia oryzae]KAI6445736.1 hypothetical protein MCOR17_010926 [Pyricularia oryzae]KAI6494088.1 hypothetical protein MCOR13_007644 [Pyricularia oryzae]KAI6578780.1 hypothetical protein MCOR04_006316 [Pyricularia oryzae]KAI6613422.1 hypothetical protein MCOR14_011605 [Pyricularia oryzae]
MSSEKAQELRDLEIKLQELDAEERSPDHEALARAQEQFRAEEPKLPAWGTHPETRLKSMETEANWLVRPSENLGARLLCQMHYPPLVKYPARELFDDKVVDIKSGCITRLIASGFTDKVALFADVFWRREEPKRAIQGASGKGLVQSEFDPWSDTWYPDEVRERHLSFTDCVHRSSAAKVMILFGTHSRNGYLRRWGALEKRLQIVPIWVPLWEKVNMGVKNEIWVLYKNSDREQIDKLVVCAPHPEHIIKKQSSEYGKMLDDMFSCAARMARIQRTEKEETYSFWKGSTEETNRAADGRSAEEKAVAKTKAKQSRLSRGVAASAAGQESSTTGAAPTPKAKSIPVLDQYSTSRSGSLDIVCRDCSSRQTDRTPYYWNADQRFYVAREWSCPVCREQIEADHQQKTLTLGGEKPKPIVRDSWRKPHLPADETIPWVLGKKAQLASTPSERIRSLNDIRARDQTLRQFEWDLSQDPDAKDKAKWKGPIGDIRLTASLGDVNATKSTSKKVGQDKRYNGKGRWAAKGNGAGTGNLGQTPGQPSQPVAGPSSADPSGEKVQGSLKRQLEDASDTNGKKQKPLAPIKASTLNKPAPKDQKTITSFFKK